MLIVVVLLSILAAASSTPVNSSYTFDLYMNDFHLQYDSHELETRRAMFETELKRVIAHNSKTHLKWKETMNKFSVLTATEKQASYGRNKGLAKAQEKTLKHQQPLPADFKILPVASLPKAVDWREKGIVTPVKDQGHCGSCWAFASTATVESHIALQSGLLFEMSPQQVAMCAPNPDHCGGVGACEGSTAELAFEYLTGSDGFYEEYQYSYKSYDGKDYACATDDVSKYTSPKATISGYVKLPGNNYAALMNAVANIGPMAINVDASSWSAYSEGVFDGCDQASPDVNHVVVMVGYGEESDGTKYWLVRNSWSPSYGEKGYIKLARTDSEDDNCGSDVTPQNGVACEDQSEPVTVCGTCGAIYDSSYPIMEDAL